MILLLIAVFNVIILIDIRGLLNNKNRLKTMIIYFVLIAIGFSMSLYQIINKNSYGPSYYLEKLIKGKAPTFESSSKEKR